jgi:hypothetical protein
MALTPIDISHAVQIQAGVLGRKTGHAFEEDIAKAINNLTMPLNANKSINGNIFTGNPAISLINFITYKLKINVINSISALSTGTLATAEEGKKWLIVNGSKISKCKSDLIINIHDSKDQIHTIGVSTKQCSNKKPTNAQLFFTTANGFINLLKSNGINVTDNALIALKEFCGENGCQPLNNKSLLSNRKTDPRRYFWEEINEDGKIELELLFKKFQKEISLLLFQKAYIDDLFIPDFLIHKTKKSESWQTTEVAIYKINELVDLSYQYKKFELKEYSIRKGSYKDPEGVSHFAPRFGIIQMQRGGQKQHPEQLQFNLEAGYFYKI